MNRGDVVVVDWQYSDRTGSKLRPAIVVQADFLNGVIDDTVLVQVTGTTRSAVTEVVLDPRHEYRAGLTRLSFVMCNNLLTIDQTLIHRKIGELSAAALLRIEDCLKTALSR